MIEEGRKEGRKEGHGGSPPGAGWTVPTRSGRATLAPSILTSIFLASPTRNDVLRASRGRRMPGMISDLLGAAAAGIRNLVLITGDPPTE